MKIADNKALIAAAQGIKQDLKPRTYSDALESCRGEFQKALGGRMPVEVFTRGVLSVVKADKALCDMAKNNWQSLVASCIKIALWGVNLSIPNEVYLIAFGGKTNAIVPMLGYKGLMKLALQAGTELGISYKRLNPSIIFEHDYFDRSFGTDSFVSHKPPKFGEPRGEPIGFYGLAEDQYGRVSYEEMTMTEMRAHFARFCKGKENKNSPWSDEKNFPRYGLKTMMRLLVNRHLPMTPKFSMAIKEDEQFENGEDLPEIDITPESPSNNQASQAAEVIE